ncbi:hypothetical protein [Mangrovibacterium lignilyticum]|uniref:hypothetical protein n=1 Tax=Mangrovibacterium lignilyticum TaxID=2668052 RepID=UPI0013D47F4B|nr:hypothetical protein [Mangrovibacterium lignilyticum]
MAAFDFRGFGNEKRTQGRASAPAEVNPDSWIALPQFRKAKLMAEMDFRSLGNEN